MNRFTSTDQMAWAAMNGSLDIEEVMKDFEFRVVKGRTCDKTDIYNAILRGVQKGQGKTETELVMVGAELAKVLKPKRRRTKE
ncbi:hypothetical protein D1872_52180 [compost metagenome]